MFHYPGNADYLISPIRVYPYHMWNSHTFIKISVSFFHSLLLFSQFTFILCFLVLKSKYLSTRRVRTNLRKACFNARLQNPARLQ